MSASRSLWCVTFSLLGFFFIVGATAACRFGKRDTIRVGLVAELSGSIPAVGASCRNGAQLAVQAINDAGGIPVGGRRMKLELVIEDCADKAEQAAAATQKLITLDRPLAIVGPNASSCALPASEIAEKGRTILIAPWSTNPRTTLDAVTGLPKRYVFRTCFLNAFEGRVLASFARRRMGAGRAAVLYDLSADVLRDQAEHFKAQFTALGGQVVAFESYVTGDKDFSAQLTRIRGAGADVLFLPSYYTDVPLQLRQARQLGIRAAFLGSDAWNTEDLIRMCGADCEGAYLTNHFSAASSRPEAGRFASAYRMRYGTVPDDVAALSYDAVQTLAEAIRQAGGVDREAVREALARLRKHPGATGSITYEGHGDPLKGLVVLQIRQGAYHFCEDVQP